MCGDHKAFVVGLGLLMLFSSGALIVSRGYADEQMLKLNGAIPAQVCNPPMKVMTGKYLICLVPISICTAHGGHVGQDANDTSGQPHCLDSDLVPHKK
jgi:hypothetical protein